MQIIAARNITVSDIYVDDLGKPLIAASATRELTTEYTQEDLKNSEDLAELVDQDKIRIIIDGIELSKESLFFNKFENDRSVLRVHANSNVSNKWMETGHGFSSDLVPLLVQQNSKIIGMSFVNAQDERNIDVEFYKNGLTSTELVHVWEIRNSRYAYKFDVNGYMDFSLGDRLAIYCKKYNKDIPRDVDIHLTFQTTSESSGSGSSPTL